MIAADLFHVIVSFVANCRGQRLSLLLDAHRIRQINRHIHPRRAWFFPDASSPAAGVFEPVPTGDD